MTRVSDVDISAEYLDLQVLAQLFNALLQPCGQEVGFLSAQEAKLGAKPSVVPVSDWAGIDLAYALAARFRAMESEPASAAPRGLRDIRSIRCSGKGFGPGASDGRERFGQAGRRACSQHSHDVLDSVGSSHRPFATALLVACAAAACGNGGHFHLPSQKLTILQGITASSFSE